MNCTRLKVGDVLIARLPNPIGRACIFPDIGQPAITAVDVAILRGDCDVCPDYLMLAINSPLSRNQIEAYGKGATRFRVSTGHLKSILVPIPPVAEQHRIAAKVDELMGLCDRLEAARQEREARHDRLVSVSFKRLATPQPDDTPESIRAHTQSTLENLQKLTTRPADIQHLRQAILNLAVRGKLVPQDSEEGLASDSLNQIATERQRLLDARQIKKQKPILPISLEEVPFEIPRQWQWSRFNEIAAIQSNLVDPKNFPDMPHIAPDNIESWTTHLLPYITIAEAGVFSGKHAFQAGSILYSKIRPNLAKVTLVDFDGFCSADMYPIHSLMDRRYLVKFMITAAFVDQSVTEDNRVATPKINQAALSNILVPIPPLAEQHRIVTKVDELMALCDRLEQSLTTTNTTRRHLLESLLHEALAPTSETLEAAE